MASFISRTPASVSTRRLPARPRPVVAHQTPPLEARDAAAESGGVDPGTCRQLSKRWLAAAADPHQKAELLCGDPPRAESRHCSNA